ncbi:hypothetical protein HPB50_012781 [Hyalomma asiaticum]|uniref:Uncharacterized protein n=1 Tax=Hyalomma asiaticum TaxID=266040 RepID=A0ACB7SEL5_HYAAI|nr:hypothetical protein HPB50_012781 [Hyalomma asiaticum]
MGLLTAHSKVLTAGPELSPKKPHVEAKKNRESKIRNTRVTVLAQGDNQVVNTSYPIPGRPTKDALKKFMIQIQKNNTAIMNAILDGTTKLGLTLNREETMLHHLHKVKLLCWHILAVCAKLNLEPCLEEAASKRIRESKIRNTRVTVLAQGDNQVVNTSYPIPGRPTKDALKKFMIQIQKNNTAIMNAILDGTTKLGLTLNREETMRKFKIPPYNDWGQTLWIFADFQSPKLMSVSCVCHELYQWYFLREGTSLPKRKMADLKSLVQLRHHTLHGMAAGTSSPLARCSHMTIPSRRGQQQQHVAMTRHWHWMSTDRLPMASPDDPTTRPKDSLACAPALSAPLDQPPSVSKVAKATFSVGDEFASFTALQEKIALYSSTNFVKLWKRDARTIEGAKKPCYA